MLARAGRHRAPALVAKLSESGSSSLATEGRGLRCGRRCQATATAAVGAAGSGRAASGPGSQRESRRRRAMQGTIRRGEAGAVRCGPVRLRRWGRGAAIGEAGMSSALPSFALGFGVGWPASGA